MFKIGFKDVGENRVTKDVTTSVMFEGEAKAIAIALCMGMLGGRVFEVLRMSDNEYILYDTPVMLGSFMIENVRG